MENPSLKYPTISFDSFTYKISLEFADWASAEESLNLDLYGGDREKWSGKRLHSTVVILFTAIHRSYAKIHKRAMILDDARELINWDNMQAVDKALGEAMTLFARRVSNAAGNVQDSNGAPPLPIPFVPIPTGASAGISSGVTVELSSQESESKSSGV